MREAGFLRYSGQASMRAAASHFRIPSALGILACWLAAGMAATAQAPVAGTTAPMGATVIGDGAARRVIFRTWAPNVIDGLQRRDPRARAVSQEQNKGYVLDPREFRWGTTTGWKMPPKEDLVMYEMHLGTFTAGIPGTGSPFERAAKRLPYLKALGINCIQLMPVNEFTGERSWGYNPGDLFAVESTYGGADGFKSFIRTCHTNGIAVLLDVVHNHYGPSDIAAWQYDQRLPADNGGIYFYVDEERRSTEWGPRPDFGKPEVRAFIADSIRTFLEEYRVDGFRWDSVHNIRYYANGARSNPDGDRALAEINDWMRKNSAFQATLSSMVRGGDSQRNMELFAAELERLDGFNWVNFAECHDSAGDLNRHHRLPAYIDPAAPDSPRARALALLAGGIALTVPGFPMLLQGFEMHDVEDFSDSTPVPWARAQNTHAGIVRAHADLIRLRRDLKGLTPGLKGAQLDVLHCDDNAKVVAYARLAAGAPRDRATVVVANFSGAPLKQYGVRFPASGAWYCHYNSGLGVYAKDFDNAGPKPDMGYVLPPGQTTLPLDMSRYSLLVFSKTAPPNVVSMTKAAPAKELPGTAKTAESAPAKPIVDYLEEVLAPFPYVLVPLPIEWKP